MKIKIGIKTVSRLLSLLLIVIGCSHDPKVKEFPVTASPTEEIFLLNRDMQIAQDAQSSVLSPKNFKEAKKHQREAVEALNENKSPQETLRHVAMSRHYLDKATHYTKISNSHLKGVGEARQRAIDAGAKNYYNYEITKADRKLRDLTADIEKDDNENAIEDATETQVRYLNIELKSLKKKYLGESENIVKQAKDEGAEKNAPKSLAITEKSISDSAAYIRANRQDAQGMSQVSRVTYNHAKLLLKINRDVKSGESSSSEDMALEMNNEKNKVAGLNQQMAQQEQTISNNKTRIITLASQKEEMQERQDQDQRFKKAKNRFNQKEASVYTKGDSLLIRLHGLKFTTAKSELNKDNLDLLKKVNLAIEDSGSTKIQVIGHTDSVGGKQINAKVSRERAEVIKNYLQNYNDEDRLLIETKGLDFQQPIATNKTANGRALNRRVDIIIEPMQSTQE